MQVIYSTLIKELHSYAKNNQYQKAVIGLSGGLDSAVTLCIATRAFGSKNITTLSLPEIGLTPNDDIDHARALAEHFGTNHQYQPINNFLVDFNFLPWPKTETANENLKARIRALLLKNFAESQNALLIGTANKSDLCLGLGSVDAEFTGEIHPLGDLFKTDIIKLAELIGLPTDLIEKPSSRQLRPHQTDEQDLGSTWTMTDEILNQLINKMDPETLIEKGIDSLTVHKIVRMMQQSEGKSKNINIIPAGHIKEAINKAQEAEASSI